MQSTKVLLSKPRANYRGYGRRDEMGPRQCLKRGCNEYDAKVIDQTKLNSVVADDTQVIALNDLLRTGLDRIQSIKASLKEKENSSRTDWLRISVSSANRVLAVRRYQ